MATPVGNAVPISSDPFVAGLTQGGKWVFSGAPVLTYSEHNDPPSASYWTGAFSDVFAQAFAAWANVANVSFSRVSGPPDLTQTGADIALALFSNASAPQLVAAEFPPDPALADRVLAAMGFSRSIWPRPEGDMGFNLASNFQAYLQPGGVGRFVALHEIGHVLGLKHPFDDGGNGRPTFSQLGIGAFDDGLWTVLSYDYINPSSPTVGHQATPMPLDIKAVQAIYGANNSYHVGDDVYRLVDDGVVRTIWDAGGTDTLDASALAGAGAKISLDAGAFSQHGAKSITAIAFNVAIENALGSNLADSISGNGLGNRIEGGDGSDQLAGNAGDDALLGGTGDDQLKGGGGQDALDGGDGHDIAIYTAVRNAYTALHAPDRGLAVGQNGGGGDGLDRLVNIELLNFADRSLAAAATDGSLEYVASHNDLIDAFGANPQAGFDHFLNSGYREGRQASFNGLEYIASYGDLINALGANADCGAAHYITSGRLEGRTTTFDGLAYIASYGDLANAFGANADAGASHYITNGRIEGRTVSFDGLEYIASYGDLIGAFGVNADAGATHYIVAGLGEGRTTTFDGLQYIASHGDLIEAFGPNRGSGSTHYITNGFGEGRAPDTFDEVQYLANYADLRAAFGNDYEAATIHYITDGYAEGRTDHA